MTRARTATAALALCLAAEGLAEAQEAAASSPPAVAAFPETPAPSEPPASTAPPAPARGAEPPAVVAAPSAAPQRVAAPPPAPPPPAPAATADAELLDAYTTYADDARQARLLGAVVFAGVGAGAIGVGLALPEDNGLRIPLLVTGPIFVVGGGVMALVPSSAERNLGKLQSGVLKPEELRAEWKAEAELAATTRYIVGTLAGVIGAGVIGLGIYRTVDAEALAASSGDSAVEVRETAAVLIGLGAVDVTCAAILLLFPSLPESSYAAYERRRKAGSLTATRSQGPTWELAPAPLGIGLGARGTF